jgi:predicted extracellular nuclease
MRTLILVLFSMVTVVSACGAQESTAPAIHDIQGAGHISPYLRQDVEGVMGVVTAIPLGTGFYMQSPEPDDDPATSEGIYVDTLLAPNVRVGDQVRVSGRVDERYINGAGSGDLPVTILRRVDVEIIRRSVPLPDPTIIGSGGVIPPGEVITDDATGTADTGEFDPANDGLDFYESLEGMLVQVNDALSVGTAHNVYGEIWVVPDRGAHASVLTSRGGIALREGDGNPDRLLIDYIEDEPFFYQREPLRTVVGDLYTAPIIGVISYSWLNYKILPLEPLPPVIPRMLQREQAAPVGPETLSVASFNVYNLSARDSEAKFADIATTIVEGLASPDIVVLAEVQDDDGARRSDTVSAGETAGRLIDAIVAAGGPSDYAYLDVEPGYNSDGGEPNGNIRVGFLFRAERVTFDERPGAGPTTEAEITVGSDGPSLRFNPARVNPTAAAFTNSRKPLVGEFTFRGERVFVIGNHFNSKSGDGGPFGWVQPPQLRSEAARVEQAQEVAAFVDELLAADPSALIIVAGDLNDFAFSPPLRVLEGEGRLTNLASLLSEGEIYTYIYEGNSQALDHILVSDELLTTHRATVDIIHRYCEYLYEDRYGDHDPVLARFRF